MPVGMKLIQEFFLSTKQLTNKASQMSCAFEFRFALFSKLVWRCAVATPCTVHFPEPQGILACAMFAARKRANANLLDLFQR